MLVSGQLLNHVASCMLASSAKPSPNTPEILRRHCVISDFFVPAPCRSPRVGWLLSSDICIARCRRATPEQFIFAIASRASQGHRMTWATKGAWNLWTDPATFSRCGLQYRLCMSILVLAPQHQDPSETRTDATRKVKERPLIEATFLPFRREQLGSSHKKCCVQGK